MISHRITLTLAALALLGCAKGRTPPDKTPTIAIGSATAKVTGSFGEVDDSQMCSGGALGSFCSADKPQQLSPHMEVSIAGFEIDQHEVTNFQYQHCVARGECGEPKASIIQLATGEQVRYYDADSSDYADYPVVNVTWSQAKDYCAFAGKRLPTEIEWEIAARKNTDGDAVYPWGDDPDDCKGKQVAIKGCGSSFTIPAPAKGGTKDDAMAIGNLTLTGMAGNVSEWTATAYDAYLSCAERMEKAFTDSNDNPCQSAFAKCAAETPKKFKDCAANVELCQECRDEADVTAAVNPECFGECLDKERPIWICERHADGDVVSTFPANGDESKRSIRGGNYTTTDLCQARFSSRVDRFEEATKFSPTLGFRCARSL